MPAMPRSRAIWKACAGRCRSTRPGHRHAARPARRGAGAARCAASASACLAAGRRRRGLTSPRRGRPWARRRLPPNTRAMPGPRPGARRTRRQPAPRCCNRRPRPAGPRCCRPSVAQRQERAGRLAETRSHHDLLARRLGEAEAALDGQRPALIEQDALRFEQSAALEREAQQRRHGEMLQLQGKLDQAGAQGLGERLSEAEADCERLQRRRDELDRRAQALDLLLRLLSDKRAAATQRLQAPLARRLRHYLGCCSPKRRCAWTMPCCPPPCSAPAARTRWTA